MKTKSKILQRILDRTKPETKIFVHKYADIVIRVNELIEKKGLTSKGLADQMGKSPSELHKWLNGEHNFTLRSISKLEAELGETILEVPKAQEKIDGFKTTTFTVHSRVEEQESTFNTDLKDNYWSETNFNAKSLQNVG